MKMKTAYQSAVEALATINITPKVYMLIIDGKYIEAYASKETAEYEMHLCEKDRKSTRLNSSHSQQSRMPSSA